MKLLERPPVKQWAAPRDRLGMTPAMLPAPSRPTRGHGLREALKTAVEFPLGVVLTVVQFLLLVVVMMTIPFSMGGPLTG